MRWILLALLWPLACSGQAFTGAPESGGSGGKAGTGGTAGTGGKGVSPAGDAGEGGGDEGGSSSSGGEAGSPSDGGQGSVGGTGGTAGSGGTAGAGGTTGGSAGTSGAGGTGCQPLTYNQVCPSFPDKHCGIVPDGCGGDLDCGGCEGATFCAHTENLCRATSERCDEDKGVMGTYCVVTPGADPVYCSGPADPAGGCDFDVDELCYFCGP
jgi:hypothetical protein